MGNLVPSVDPNVKLTHTTDQVNFILYLNPMFLSHLYTTHRPSALMLFSQKTVPSNMPLNRLHQFGR